MEFLRRISRIETIRRLERNRLEMLVREAERELLGIRKEQNELRERANRFSQIAVGVCRAANTERGAKKVVQKVELRAVGCLSQSAENEVPIQSNSLEVESAGDCSVPKFSTVKTYVNAFEFASACLIVSAGAEKSQNTVAKKEAATAGRVQLLNAGLRKKRVQEDSAKKKRRQMIKHRSASSDCIESMEREEGATYGS